MIILIFASCPNCGNLQMADMMKGASTFYFQCQKCGHGNYIWYFNPSLRLSIPSHLYPEIK